ncbi:MAG: PIN domain-containing protein [Deferrisomatales bacterium]
MPPAVIDTNVVVSGLITGARDAPTARVLDAMLAGRFLFFYSAELLGEYREVLLRPSLRRLHGLGEDEVDVVMAELALNGAHRAPAPSSARAPDPGDQHLWDLLACEPGAVLVTGDGLLLARAPSFAAVLSPGDFAQRLSI